MRNFLFYLLISTVSGDQPPNQPPTYNPALVDPSSPIGMSKAYDSSLVMISIDTLGNQSHGSGNLVNFNGREIIITAAHIFENSIFGFAVEKNDAILAIEILSLDKELDIAILELKEKATATSSVEYVNSEQLYIGKNIYHCGHPLGITFNLSEGIITSIYSPNKAMVNSFSMPGSSGSLVFDSEGRIIGVISSVLVYTDPDKKHMQLVPSLSTFSIITKEYLESIFK